MLSEHIQKMESQTEDLVLNLSTNLEWINSAQITNEDLKGKIVVLFFWTSCCINCRHSLPYISKLQKKYEEDPVVFIGVHSPKYDNEKHLATLKNILARQGIEYPVVNDRKMEMMSEYGIKSWPTFLVSGPQGRLLFSLCGENQKELLDDYIDSVLNYYSEFSSSKIEQPLSLSKHICYPEKIVCDASAQKLYISDTCFNRVLITDLEGNCLDCIKGFNQPRGIFLDGDCLFVADTGNHCVKAVHLKTKLVATLAGNGWQGRDYKGGEIGMAQALSSPWDLVKIDNRIYIAMAGTHQIWILDLDTGVAKNYSGCGAEQNYNSVNVQLAAWAQPAGIAKGEHQLYVADSESSTIRSIDLMANSTSTLVGGSADSQDLFSFGDKDGQGDEAKLQRPMAVQWLPSFKKIVVADTFNHKIKWIDPITLSLSTLCGKGEAGHRDGSFEDALFNEPSGIACHEYLIYVADTNNSCIRVIDLLKRTVDTLDLKGIPHD